MVTEDGTPLSVSILSQLRCWEQLSVEVVEVARVEFQSSPSLGAGSNAREFIEWAGYEVFQSSPSLGAGSNVASSPVSIRPSKGFNPLPA